MQVDYSKLWERYKEKGYKNKTDLISLADVSTNIVAKLNKGELLSKEYYADFVCYDKIIVELKAVTSLVKAHKAQVINYLKAADKEIGLLVNFGCNSLKWERISKFETRENR
ncbi:MAG: GxxExxY protein [Treponema sp.]|nr:GxxExxY protein [Treponema sp.]